MQRQINVIDPFPEAIEVDQGSIVNNTGMSQQTSFNNILNPVERRLSINAVPPDEASCMNAVSHDVQTFYGWNSGESSSSFSSQNNISGDEIKVEGRWPPSVDVMVGSSSEYGEFEPVNNILPERVSISVGGNQIRSRPLFLRGSSSNHAALNLNTAEQYVVDGDNQGYSTAAIIGPNHVGTDGIEEASPLNVYPDGTGTSSGISGNLLEEGSGSGSSLGGCGSSCKRKALEGTSGHSYQGGSSSCFPQADNDSLHTGATRSNASSSSSLSTPAHNSPGVDPFEQVNPSAGFEMRVASDSSPFSNPRNADLWRTFGRRVHPDQQQESTALNLSTGVARSSSAWSSHQSARLVPFSESLDLRSTATTAAAASSSVDRGQPHAMHGSASSRYAHRFPWHRPSDSRVGNPPRSFIPIERGIASHEEADLRSISSSAENSMYVPLPEIRSMAQDPGGWSLATRSTSTSGGAPSTRVVPSSNVHTPPTSSWFPQHQPTSLNQQRFSEFAPWSLFPPLDSESGGPSTHFPPLSSGPSSSSQETRMSSGSSSQGRNQPFLRSVFMEGQSDDVLGMPRSVRALATDFEGRHRLISEIRQVLTAMRRGEHLRVEDYMLFDPFIYHGVVEMQDRHRDMRLDVDNMSYEELLALEERIGDVSTGLSEEAILKLLKQQKYASATADSSEDQEPCCVCQEEYVDGDDLGMLDCGHDFHSDCIKQWLMVKNLCPICKMAALPT